jgi:hypothetical protein
MSQQLQEKKAGFNPLTDLVGLPQPSHRVTQLRIPLSQPEIKAAPVVEPEAYDEARKVPVSSQGVW